MWERLNRADANSLYEAARNRAVTAAVIAASDKSPEAIASAAAEADRALDWLGKAVAAGYVNFGSVRQDSDFQALRAREDFQQLLAAGKAKRLADLSREVERNPKDANAYRARGTFLCQAGRFREALADIEKATELAPRSFVTWYDAATVNLSLGDIDRYNAACRQMLERFEKREDPQVADIIAKSCALAPDSVPDFARVERLAERCVTGTEGHRFRRWFVLTKGLTDYRAGRHEQAIEWLERFAPRARGTHSDATAFAALAMAHHRLGHAKEARASLDAARAVVAKMQPDAGSPDGWRDWLHCEILCREAEQVLAK
jgi:tetratricopeptide (TPR) repeat protein